MTGTRAGKCSLDNAVVDDDDDDDGGTRRNSVLLFPSKSPFVFGVADVVVIGHHCLPVMVYKCRGVVNRRVLAGNAEDIDSC